MQSSREGEANTLQSSREQTAEGMQSSAQQYRGSYPFARSAYPGWDWDAGTGVPAATGAAIGAAAGSAIASPSLSSSGSGAAVSAPCANAVTIPVGGMEFFRCGFTWYREAYGPAGPTFVRVRRPGLL